MNEFIEQHSVARVRLVTPQPERLRALLNSHGIAVKQDEVERDGKGDDGPDGRGEHGSAGGALLAVGAEAETIGGIIAANQVTVSEISTQHASLEEAFLRITAQYADDTPRSAR
jgi:ABC-2 type transport system ATP-binding protein